MRNVKKRIAEKEARHAARQLAADANDLQPPSLRKVPTRRTRIAEDTDLPTKED